MHKPRVCVIGAGSSGLIASKTLHERGIEFDCFDKSSGIGGLWRYNNDNGMSAAYKSLHINSSRYEMAFSDFKMPDSYPDFPHHSQVLEYFENYVNHFGFRDRIQFRTTVNDIRPDGDGDGYRVCVETASGKREHHYDSVIVGNGHHWSPKRPEFPGEFSGQSFHSYDYKTTAGLEGKRILVVGIGNSGCDIACELARVSEQTFLSTRQGAHIIPKYIFGKPLDRICPPWFWNHLPFRMLQKVFSTALYLSRGRLTRYGLPHPDHRILEEHPTVSSDLLNLIGHGKVKVKPNVRQFDGHAVEFDDDSRDKIDVVIYATGYNIRFPFLNPDIIDPVNNEVPLYKRVVHPTHQGLYFIGLVQPWGPLNPLSESQCQWVADLIDSKAVTPPESEMLNAIRKERETMRKRYGNSVRHTIQVDFHPYLRELSQARKAGQQLAARQTPSSNADRWAQQPKNVPAQQPIPQAA